MRKTKEEKANIRKYKKLGIFLIIIAIIYVGISYFFIIKSDKKYNTNNSNNDITTKKTDNYEKNVIRITDVNSITTVRSSTEIDNCKINTEGKLEGDCYNDDLKDIIFTKIAPYMSDIGPAAYLVLASDGTVYKIYGSDDENVMSDYEIYTDQKIEDLKYIYGGAIDCTYSVKYIFTINGQDINQSEMPNVAGTIISCDSIETKLPYLYYLTDRTVASSDFKTILKYNNENLVVEYAIYEYDNGVENLYVTTDDKNVYKYSTENLKVELIGTYKNLDYNFDIINKEGGITITLTNGKVLTFDASKN